MAPGLWVFYALAVALRLGSLAHSRRNERRLRAEGAVEHGAANSRRLSALHVIFYLAALTEGLWRRSSMDALSVAGMALYLLSALALLWVLRQLGALWTVRIYLAPNPVLNQSRLFRWVRHPNYRLTILPELIGLGLALHSLWTLLIGLPLYVVVLWVRIRQEEAVLRKHFGTY